MMSIAKKSLSPEAQMRVTAVLNQTDWLAIPAMERMTKFRAQKEQLEALARAREVTGQAHEAKVQAREATAWLERWQRGGGRYGQ
jgi:hypothetical protein